MRSLIKVPLTCLMMLGTLAALVAAVWLLEVVGRGADVLGIPDVAFAVALILAAIPAGLGIVFLAARQNGAPQLAGGTVTSSARTRSSRTRRQPGMFTPAIVLVDRSDTWKGVAGLGALTLVWNGFIWGVYLLMRQDRGVPFFATLIIGLFMVIGGFMVLGLISKSWRMLHYAPGELAVERWPLRLGEDVQVTFRRRLKRRFTVRELVATLTCEESARYRRGTDVTTVKEKVWESSLEPERTITSGPVVEGMWTLHLPEDLPPTFSGTNNKIQWKLEVKLRAKGGPGDGSEFKLIIAPEVVV